MDTREIPASGKEEKEEAFRGVFTPSLRRRFREHRIRLGVSLQLLGEVLRIHWSTVRKWEAGISRKCQPRHVARVQAFLAREYDQRLLSLAAPEVNVSEMMRRMPRPLHACMERAWMVYGVSQCYPGEENCLLGELRDALDQTADLILKRLDEPPDPQR
ncbi:MAG: hypothetical protein ACI4SG_02615 [Oligosphaeraceae bacterium]